MTLVNRMKVLEDKYYDLKAEFKALKVDIENLTEIMKCYATQQIELNLEFRRLVDVLHGDGGN